MEAMKLNFKMMLFVNAVKIIQKTETYISGAVYEAYLFPHVGLVRVYRTLNNPKRGQKGEPLTISEYVATVTLSNISSIQEDAENLTDFDVALTSDLFETEGADTGLPPIMVKPVNVGSSDKGKASTNTRVQKTGGAGPINKEGAV